jgi:toxin ParE1/3/4
MPKVIIRPGAWREIDRQIEYLQAEAGAKTAERFLDSLMESCNIIAAMPLMGRLCEFDRQSLKNLRRWPVVNFENWLIFYLPLRDGIEVVYVTHGARDIENLLASELSDKL